ncbi:hypothetical protein L1D41_14400 [Vibrio harveyi]|uniref:hypothetical protein n=1 Tax=Vibrio harveyi TaxID=669 RepID=UPI001EFDF837|nr:hypothetical protein [Vibrio harveyi]MCG9610853.1 hypothetical protein [Vibrio harveyi]MCG9669257.1 hypothetical protein [Vibrio harveyi]
MKNNQNIILTSKTVTATKQMTSEEFFSKNGRKAFQDAKRTLKNKRTCLNEYFKDSNPVLAVKS